MLEIKVTVDIPGLPEAITALASAMAGTPRTDTPDVKKTSRTRSTKKEPPAEEPKSEPDPVAPAVPATPEPTTTPTTVAPTPVPETPPAAPVAAPPTDKPLTMNDIATAGAQLIDKGKMGQLLELLKKHNVQAVTQLKEADYTAFAEDLRALGAEI